MNKFVTCEFLGRLANNLFQVAVCINYSKKYNVPWLVMPGYHHPKIYKYFNLPKFIQHKHRINPKKIHVYDTATDEGYPFKELPYFDHPVKLRGFWQSYKYLDPVKEEFLKVLNFKKYDDLHDFTSIHIRRTDYVTYSNNFGAVSLEYVQSSIDKIKEILGTRPQKFIVFSDDIPWCRQEFSSFFPNDVFVFSEGKNEYEELSKMSSCKNNIIANSSFSYIAAYANTNPDKIVLSPSAKDWFGPNSKLDTRDLLPPDWNQINWR
jgi:hypothetical protein